MRMVDLLVRPVRALLINHALIALEGGADRAADRVKRAGTTPLQYRNQFSA